MQTKQEKQKKALIKLYTELKKQEDFESAYPLDTGTKLHDNRWFIIKAQITDLERKGIHLDK
jgi:hypothetical protein